MSERDKCKKCRYASHIYSRDHNDPKAAICDYIGKTGRARSKICKPGDECTVFAPLEAKTKTEEKAPKAPRNRAVLQIDADGNVVARFDGARGAAEAIGRSRSAIRQAIRTGCASSGYWWRYE